MRRKSKQKQAAEAESAEDSASAREIAFDEDELRERLTPEQYHVTQEAGTERAFTGETWDNKGEGQYRCVVCDAELFDSETKFESGTGWPSFWGPTEEGAVDTASDRSYGMVRTEAMCMKCGAHLGHVFPDGPNPSGDRYCMNSASLKFVPADGSDKEDSAS